MCLAAVACTRSLAVLVKVWYISGALDESAVCDGAELDQQRAPLPGKQQKKPPCERPPSTLPLAESTKASISAPGEGAVQDEGQLHGGDEALPETQQADPCLLREALLAQVARDDAKLG